MSVINQQLFIYVQNALNQGHNLESIKTWLIKNNVPQKDLDEVINYFSRQQSTIIPDTMPIQSNAEVQIRDYLNSQLSQGYTAEAIRKVLIARGYNPYVISKIINENQNLNINVKHEVHLAGKTFIGIFFVLLLLGGVVYAIFFSGLILNKETPLLDVSVEADKYSFYAGDNINYQITLVSTGSKQRFDVNVRYVIYDELNLIKKSYSETLAVETKTSSKGTIAIPSNLAPGRYFLKALADYNGKTAESTIEFEVIGKTNDNNQNPIVQINQTINHSPNNQINQNLPVISNPSANTFGDAMTSVREQAKESPDVAANICYKFTSQIQKDACLSAVADSSGRISYCNNIKTQDYQDNCYLSFVLKEGYVTENTTICDKIIDNNTKEYCNQIKIVALMNMYYLQNRSDKIMELNMQFNPDIYNSNPTTDLNTVNNQPSTISLNDISILINVSEEQNITQETNNS